MEEKTTFTFDEIETIKARAEATFESAVPLDPLIIQALTTDLMNTCPQICCNHVCSDGRQPQGLFERPTAYESHYAQAQKLLREGWVNRA